MCIVCMVCIVLYINTIFLKTFLALDKDNYTHYAHHTQSKYSNIRYNTLKVRKIERNLGPPNRGERPRF